MIKLIKTRSRENEHDFSTVTMTAAEDASLDEALQLYERFLRACGYVFDGELVVSGEAD